MATNTESEGSSKPQAMAGPPPRNAAAQRRAMQAALAASVRALRSAEGRVGGWRRPGSGGPDASRHRCDV